MLMQPPGNPPNCQYRVIGLVKWQQQCGHIKIEPTKVKTAQEYKKTHLGCDNAMQPLGFPSKCSHWVYRPLHRCGRIKSGPTTNVSQMEMNKNAYLGHAHMIRLTRRPKKRIKRLNELTFSSRMQGEPQRNVEDYGWADVQVAISTAPGWHRLCYYLVMRVHTCWHYYLVGIMDSVALQHFAQHSANTLEDYSTYSS